MKRAQQEEQKCRRMEFKCKLYGIIKDLDRSLKSECGQTRPPAPGQTGGLGSLNGYVGKERKQKGSECCCPPGCCEESLKFRLPKLLPKEDPSRSHAPAEGAQDPDGTGTGHLGWHNDDHSWGCRPVGEGGPGSQRGCMSSSAGGGGNPNMGGGSPNNFNGASQKCGEGSPNFGGGCCSYKPVSNVSPNPSPTSLNGFQFPQSPEEAIQRGCFVARTA